MILFLLVGGIDVSIYRALEVNPNSVKITYKTLKSDKIPDSLTQVSAVYITDLEYGNFVDANLASQIFAQIGRLDPDLFFFGGDLFASEANVDDQKTSEMTGWLNSIQAPLGKFAVLGEQDLIDETRLAQVRSIYDNSQIELIENRSLSIGNQSKASIKLVGLSINSDIGAAFNGISHDQYVLLLSHYPDPLVSDQMSLVPIDMALCGNAHGTQITWPIFGGYREWEGSTLLNRAELKSLPFDYYLSSGLGCINVHARLNAPVEIVHITFTK